MKHLRVICLVYFLSNLDFVFSCSVQHLNPFDYKKIHIAALVLARGGSKGIKLKNLATINGKTLLAISLKAILGVRSFDSVWVSTDNDKIYQEAVNISKHVNVHWRSAESASDTATSIFALQEFMGYRPEVDVIALMQCTSPFVRAEYLKKAILLILQKDVDCVFSVTRSYKLRWYHQNGKTMALNFNPAKRPRRQDWDGEFTENGMFYFAKRHLLKKGLFQNENCKLVEIPEEHSLEIDSPYHLKLAQKLTEINTT